MMRRKILVITGTRAEFGLLINLLREIEEDESLELQLIVTGMHLSPEFGFTYKEIEKNDIKISRKIEILLSSDSVIGISKSMGLGLISFSEAFEDLKPDIIVVLGDRFEILTAVTAASVGRIPIAHIHGGEATLGAFDEAFRHSITKMSHLHFTSTEQYRQRVIQLGEHPDRVFNTGSPGIDNIESLSLLSKSDFERSIDFSLGNLTFLITFHPVTLEKETSEHQFKALLKALDSFPEARLIFTKPNADTDGRVIINLMDQYVKENEHRAKSFHSLGQLRYLSALKYVNVVVGNSSSGLIEAPSFKLPTVNIGDRQKGRVKADNVIDSNVDAESIISAIKKALSDEFVISLKNLDNPYGKKGASARIKEYLKSYPLNNILKKEFYDIKTKQSL